MPYTDQFTVGYERQLGSSIAVSADYVRANSRDLLMSKDLNAGLRGDDRRRRRRCVRQGSAALTAGVRGAARRPTPGSRNFTTAVTQPLNVGETDYDALLVSFKKRFSQNYEARVSYTLSKSRGNTSGNGAPTSGFQVLDDMHLELNEGPTNFDIRHNFVVSGRALVPKTGGLNVSWVARALSGTPFTLTNSHVDPDRNGTFAEPLPAGNYTGSGADPYTVENYRAAAQRRLRPGVLPVRRPRQLRVPLRRRDASRCSSTCSTSPNRANFLNPTANQASAQFLLLTDYSTSYTPRKVQIGARYQF